MTQEHDRPDRSAEAGHKPDDSTAPETATNTEVVGGISPEPASKDDAEREHVKEALKSVDTRTEKGK